LHIVLDGHAGGIRTHGYRVVLIENDIKIKEISKRLGKGTNNIAEWSALIEGLKLALAHGCKELEVRETASLS